jgi:hypothetical protein
MHADRIDRLCLTVAAETQRIVMMVLLTGGSGPWSRDELQREIEGSRREAVDVAEAIDALYGAGLIHVSDELICPTRAARLMAGLRL